MSIKSETYYLQYKLQTDAAIGVTLKGDDNLFFLPKSQIDINQDYEMLSHGECIDIEIPDWLAEKVDLL
jgi:hypothetical protein